MQGAQPSAEHNHVYEDIASKFFEHFLNIAQAISSMCDDLGLWDETDQFFYDVLNLPDDVRGRMRIRSTLGKGTLVVVRLPFEPQCLLPKEEAA